MYNFPLQLSFKIISWGPQVSVRDANHNEVFYVQMKALKLKEDVRVFSNSSKSNELFNIQADRIIDFSATYHIRDSMETELGKVSREGVQSLFKASYNIHDASDNDTFKITEDNPWIRAGDMLLESIPVLNMFAGYFFHPSYTTYRAGSETPLVRLTKEPALFEGKFKVELFDTTLNQNELNLILLSNMMMVLLERTRG